MVQFIVFSGLPGTGKSSLAEAVGRALDIPVFAKDWLEAPLRRLLLKGEVELNLPLGYIGYELLSTLASRQLTLEQSVILDSVATTTSIRETWRQLALKAGAQWRVVECICSNEGLHRHRLAARQRQIPGWPELTWEDVARVQAQYATWEEARLRVDAVEPLEANLKRVLAYLDEGLGGALRV